MNSKILSLERLGNLRQGLKDVVLSHGTFDCLHAGHLEHFRQAKALGDWLIVTITADKFVNKGPGRPFLSQDKRAENIAAIDFVDFVAVIEDATAIPAIKAIRPDIFCRGKEYESNSSPTWLKEKIEALASGAQIKYTSGFVDSSSRIINGEFSSHNPKMESYLKSIRQKYQYCDIKRWLDNCQLFNCLVLGEQIRDNYIFVQPEGKSRKDSIVTFRQTGQAGYHGGANIVKQGLSKICPNTTLLSSPTEYIDKTRYVLEPYYQKLFAVAAGMINPAVISEFVFKQKDLIVAADFGSGYFSSGLIEQIFKSEIFTALSVQTNSLNFGFNLASRWLHADYLLLDDEELRLNMRDKSGDIVSLAQRQKLEIGAKYVAITRGHEGCLVISDKEIAEAPALATKVIDRLGSGDAFFAVTAPLARAGAPADMIALAGNIAAGISVGKLGNVATEKEEILRWAATLLK